MSGDVLRRLLPHQRRAAEDAAHAVLRELRLCERCGERHSPFVVCGEESLWFQRMVDAEEAIRDFLAAEDAVVAEAARAERDGAASWSSAPVLRRQRALEVMRAVVSRGHAGDEPETASTQSSTP